MDWRRWEQGLIKWRREQEWIEGDKTRMDWRRWKQGLIEGDDNKNGSKEMRTIGWIEGDEN